MECAANNSVAFGIFNTFESYFPDINSILKTQENLRVFVSIYFFFFIISTYGFFSIVMGNKFRKNNWIEKILFQFFYSMVVFTSIHTGLQFLLNHIVYDTSNCCWNIESLAMDFCIIYGIIAVILCLLTSIFIVFHIFSTFIIYVISGIILYVLGVIGIVKYFLGILKKDIDNEGINIYIVDP